MKYGGQNVPHIILWGSRFSVQLDGAPPRLSTNIDRTALGLLASGRRRILRGPLPCPLVCCLRSTGIPHSGPKDLLSSSGKESEETKSARIRLAAEGSGHPLSSGRPHHQELDMRHCWASILDRHGSRPRQILAEDQHIRVQCMDSCSLECSWGHQLTPTTPLLGGNGHYATQALNSCSASRCRDMGYSRVMFHSISGDL